jgi:parallel beta-helix repeat protein
MMACYLGNLRNIFTRVALGFCLALCLTAPPWLGQAQDKPDYGALFTEEILTVHRERDGILPGTLRSALIQANSIRAQNSFTLVKIVFDPNIQRVQISNGPLPEVDGSLTTIDCTRPQGKVVLEYLVPADNAGEAPGEEPSVITLSSNGNVVRGCHLTGAVGPGILIRGNRNVIEQNTIGYHAGIPQAALLPSALLSEPKTNGRSGITLGKGANENTLQNNLIVGNTHHGVLLEDGVGTGNKILYNTFAKNSGQPIKAQAGSQSAVVPAIKRIAQVGDTFYLEGTTSPRAQVQIYMVGEKRDQIEMLVVEGQDHPKNNSTSFSLATKSKGFVLGKTQLVAVAHGDNLNTSEFSEPIIVGIPEQEAPAAATEPVQETAAEDHDTGDGEEKAEGEAEASNETPEATPTTPQGSKTGKTLGSSEPDTVINLHGQGDGGSSPDSGGEKQSAATGMGN